jgi:hypothetical protein
MPHLRYSRDCDWHVFEEVKTGETESRLAVWQKDLEAQGASSVVIMTQKMLELEDYFSITRYLPHHERMLHDAFEAWLSEQSGVETNRQLCLINSSARMSTWTKAALKR